jgi:hypothetical protein
VGEGMSIESCGKASRAGLRQSETRNYTRMRFVSRE